MRTSKSNNNEISSPLHFLVADEVLRVADVLVKHNKLSEEPGVGDNGIEEFIRCRAGTISLEALHAGWSLERCRVGAGVKVRLAQQHAR